MAESAYTAEASVSEGSATSSDSEGLLLKLKGWYSTDIKHTTTWRKEAREDFKFYSGDQWSDEDKTALEAKARVPVVFNRTAPLVNAVVGSEINNRREVQYIPREQGDAIANELLTAAGEWFRDQTGAEDEESDAFEDAVIGGMGWTDTRLDFEVEPDGAPVIERMDCMEMVWDSNAVKPNLADATRIFRVKEMPYDTAQDMFPKADKQLLHAGWAKTIGNDKDPHDQQQANLYASNQDEADDNKRKLCTIVEARWFEKQTYYRGPDYQNAGQEREYEEDQIKLIRKQFPQFPAVRQTRKVVKRCFIGSEILEEPDQPLVPPGMFGWECVTGYRDKMEAQFYGIVRATKDPQRWTNKFFSQVMFLLNSQAKGGIGAERGAFEDDRQAEVSWAKSDEITWFTKGALTGNAPKVIPKPTAQFPSGFFTLFQESKEEINQVSGLSPEFIGTREVDQAGVLEAQRRQSSLNLLASLFNSLRRYRKRQGQTMLFLIQNHLSDGRLIRIVGDDKKQYVPLTKEAVASQKYDIIVDDAPTSPNEKERTWQILQPMLPLLFKGVESGEIPPDVLLEIIKYSPLPASMVEAWIKKVAKMREEAANQPKQPTEAEAKVAATQQTAQIKAQGQQQDLAVKQASAAIDLKAQQDKAEGDARAQAIDLILKAHDAEINAKIADQKLEQNAQKIAQQSEANSIARQQANAKQTRAASGQ